MKNFISLCCICCVLFTNAQKSKSSKTIDSWAHPTWAKNATIYEVNLRQFTREGTFRAFETHLPRLRSMGVDVLWLMPIFPIGEKNRKGSLGSYYCVKDYQAVNPEHGTLDDLKHLVEAAHQQGFKVILDWVANHSSFDNALITQHPNWYKHDSTGAIVPPVADWTDVAAFDYKSKDLWQYQIESMRYWLRTADIDGFRCDVAMMVPNEFWKECRLKLDSVKKVFMLAEAEGPAFHRNGFDMTYGWEFHHLLNQLAKGEKKATDMDAYIEKNNSIYNVDDYRLYFTSNHDENSWNGTEFERMGDANKALFVLGATIPGMPLVYSGQEAALDRRLKFFDKDEIEWKNFPAEEFYKKLLQLKRTHPALANGKETGEWLRLPSNKEGIYGYLRMKGSKKILVVLNLSKNEVTATLDHKKMTAEYTELFSGNKLKIFDAYAFNLKPWEYRVYVK